MNLDGNTMKTVLCRDCSLPFVRTTKQVLCEICRSQRQVIVRRKRKAKREATRDAMRVASVPVICANCRKAFKGKYFNERRFCSRTCLSVWHRKHRRARCIRNVVYNCGYRSCLHLATCPCGSRYLRKRHHRNWCPGCTASRRETFITKRSNRRKPGGNIACGECSITFMRMKLERTCPDCKQKHRRIRASISKYKARKGTGSIAEVDPLWILLRDRHICQVCKEQLNASERGSNTDSAPEVTYRIAVAAGGDHSEDNLRCLCRKCNINKSNIGWLST